MRRILLLLALLAAAPLATGQTVWLSVCFDPGEGPYEGMDNNSRHRIYWEDSSKRNYESATVGSDPVTFYAECPQGTKVDYWLYGSPGSVESKDPSVKGGEGQSTFTVENTGQDKCLGASFDWIKYSVTFERNGGNGGSNMPQLTGIVYTNSFNLTANTYTKTGYSFSGWLDPRGVSFGDGYGISGGADFGVVDDETNVVLTAQWTPNTYTVTLYTNSVQFAATSVTYGLTYGALPTPTRTGYTFDGWYTAESNKVTSDTVYSPTSNPANHPLYADWKVVEYTVDFNGNGGTSPASISVTYDSTYGNLPTSTRAGHSFAGWWTDAVAGNQIETNTTVSTATNHTLFAHWTLLDPVTVHFLSNGGAGDMADTNILCSVSTALPLNTFERTGYTFLHWTNSVGTVYTNGASVTFSDSSTGETVVFGAVWTPNHYTVEFLPGAGSGTMDVQQFVYDAPQELSAMTFEFPSPGASFWDFVGWSNVTAGAFYEPGATVSNLTTEANGVVALTAVWASKLSELSQALDCYNLVWTNHVMDAGALGNWTVCSGEGDGSDSCVTNIWSPNLLLATITTNGVLSFSCKCTGASAGKIAIYQPKNLDASIGNSDLITNVEVTAEWHRYTLDIEWREGGFLAFRNLTTPPSIKYIDQVTWVPEGSEVEPTEEDARDISAISFDGGVLSLSFTNADERFSYNLRGTNTLSVPLSLWPILWTTNGTGTITITPPSTSISAPPSFFYYLETTSR